MLNAFMISEFISSHSPSDHLDIKTSLAVPYPTQGAASIFHLNKVQIVRDRRILFSSSLALNLLFTAIISFKKKVPFTLNHKISTFLISSLRIADMWSLYSNNYANSRLMTSYTFLHPLHRFCELIEELHDQRACFDMRWSMPSCECREIDFGGWPLVSCKLVNRESFSLE
jgi:hypothetical protein